MHRTERLNLFINKFCSIINYRLPLTEQVISSHYNSTISVLIRRYNQPAFKSSDLSPSRGYHNINHAIDCCFELDKCWETVSKVYDFSNIDYDILFLALSYHDAIYDTKSEKTKTNEQLSAEFARQQLKNIGMESEITNEVAYLVEKTDHSIAVPEDAIPSILLIRDIDLAGLGYDWTLFDHNFSAIREEYSWLPEMDFMMGRLRFMQSMVSQSYIYSTPYFRNKFEDVARNNIYRHISELEQVINN